MLAKTTYELTGSATVSTTHGAVTSVLVITDGSNPAVVIGYDKPSATGIDPTNKLFEFTVPGASQYGGRNWVVPVQFSSGLYFTISGTGASVIIEYL